MTTIKTPVQKKKSLFCIDDRMGIGMDNKHIVLVPKCVVIEGDEMRIALGCGVPVTPGTKEEGYRRVCTAYIPRSYGAEALE